MAADERASRRAKAVAWALDYGWVSRRHARQLFTPPRLRRAPDSYREGNLAPVVLLPGVYETWQFLKPIADRLNRAGHPIFVVAELGNNVGKIADSARIVASFLELRGLRHVVLVAHSKGGLIGKYLMALNDEHGRVDRLVAVNTPFSGSSYARFVPLRSVRAFVPTEPNLMMLQGRREHDARITSIYSRFDPHIPNGSFLEGARNISLGLMGHFRPLGHRLLIDTVHREVERAPNGSEQHS